MKLKTILILSALCFLLSTSLCGCASFRRKFVRKPKKEKKIEVIVRTQEYKAKYSIEEAYKKYFLFWRNWHEEMINLLKDPQDGNRKRRIFAARKTVENLEQMHKLLLPGKQAGLEVYISELKDIAGQLEKYNLRAGQKLRIESVLEKQRRRIQREFAYRHVQEYLIRENIN